MFIISSGRLKQESRKRIDTDLKDIRFEKDDLYYSIHKANIHVKGHRQSNGKWLVHATLIDKYDFTELMTLMDGGGWSTQVGLGTVANDMAVVSQKLRAINPYWVCVEFDTWR